MIDLLEWALGQGKTKQEIQHIYWENDHGNVVVQDDNVRYVVVCDMDGKRINEKTRLTVPFGEVPCGAECRLLDGGWMSKFMQPPQHAEAYNIPVEVEFGYIPGKGFQVGGMVALDRNTAIEQWGHDGLKETVEGCKFDAWAKIRKTLGLDSVYAPGKPRWRTW